MIAPTVPQISNSGQSPQVETPLRKVHLRISHICSQNTVFTPSARQPTQLICSGRIGALFNSAHNFAVFYVCIAFFAVQPAVTNHISHRLFSSQSVSYIRSKLCLLILYLKPPFSLSPYISRISQYAQKSCISFKVHPSVRNASPSPIKKIIW